MSKIKEIKALEAKIQMSAEFLEMDADDSNSQQLIATYLQGFSYNSIVTNFLYLYKGLRA